MTRHDTTRHDKTRHNMIRHDETRHDVVTCHDIISCRIICRIPRCDVPSSLRCDSFIICSASKSTSYIAHAHVRIHTRIHTRITWSHPIPCHAIPLTCVSNICAYFAPCADPNSVSRHCRSGVMLVDVDADVDVGAGYDGMNGDERGFSVGVV